MKYLRWVVCWMMVCGPLGAKGASTSGDDLKVLKGKIVFLRGMEAGDKLNFNAQGKASEDYEQGSFALSAVKIEKVHRSNTEVELKGDRVVLVFQTGSDRPSLKEIRFVATKEQVEITVAIDEAHPQSLDAAILKIFAPTPQDVLDGMPSDEEASALDSLGSTAPPGKEPSSYGPVSLKAAKQPVYKLGLSGVSPPRPVYSVVPGYTDDARKKRLSGVCILSLIVDATGHPTRIRIVRSLDPGLDVSAIAAVSQYRFEPAMYNGKAVVVSINMEVNFRIY